jgi:hypothetical protein
MWYITKLIFNINIGDGVHATQFDEQLRLINAGSPEEAFFKARALGRAEEESFTTESKKNVSWKFIDVAELSPIGNLKDGAEIYSNTYEAEEANAYIKFVRHKAMVIQSENLVFA